MQIFIVALVALYALGALLSQSLMSVSATLVLLLGVYGAGTILFKKKKTLARQEVFILGLGLLCVAADTLNVLLREAHFRDSDALRAIPLMLLPTCAWLLRPYLKNTWHNLYRAVAGVVLLSAGILLVLCAYQVLALGHFASGFFNSPIYFAYALLPFFILSVEAFLSKENLKKAWLVSAVLILLCLLLSQSRMVILVLFAYVFLRVIFLPKASQLSKARTLMLIAAVLVLAVGLWVSQPQFQEKLARSFSAKDPSFKWRLKAWSYNWQLFMEHPWFGVGPERNGIDVAVQTELRGHWKPGHLIFAHSIFLQKLAESGAISTTLYFLYWILLGLRSHLAAMLVTAMLVAGVTENIFNNSKAAHAFFFCLMFVLIWKEKTKEPRHGSA